MQKLLIFLIVSLIFLAANMFWIKILWAMMQNGGAFDVAFKWGKLRDRLYASNKPTHRMLENILGGCEQCMSFWFTPTWFFIYYAICKLSAIGWIADGVRYPFGLVVNFIWFIMFWGIGAGMSHYYLTYKNNQHGM